MAEKKSLEDLLGQFIYVPDEGLRHLRCKSVVVAPHILPLNMRFAADEARIHANNCDRTYL